MLLVNLNTSIYEHKLASLYIYIYICEKGGINIPVGSLGGLLIGILTKYLCPCILAPLGYWLVAVCRPVPRGACRGFPWCPIRAFPGFV